MIKQIICVKAVLPSGVSDRTTVAYENGKIVYVGDEILRDAEIIDGRGEYLLAGFIDLHCHGGAGFDFMDATAEEIGKIAAFHESCGTTTLVPTTMTDTAEHIAAALDGLAAYYSTVKDTPLTGAHLEGPWLSPAQCGAQSPEKMDLPSEEKLRAIIGKYPFVSRISLAPELENGIETGRAGAAAGLVVSAAHTDADFDKIVEAADNGYTLMTHLYSGMAGVTRKNAYRTAGAVEAGLYDDRLAVEIIADGKHLPSGLLKLVYKCKGADGVCLITDAMRAAGLGDGARSVLGRKDDGLPVTVEDGVAKTLDRQSFAGSVATTDRLVRTMAGIGVSLTDISKMASTTPARVMGFTDRGAIEVGKRADFVFMNDALEVTEVIRGGEIVRAKE